MSDKIKLDGKTEYCFLYLRRDIKDNWFYTTTRCVVKLCTRNSTVSTFWKGRQIFYFWPERQLSYSDFTEKCKNHIEYFHKRNRLNKMSECATYSIGIFSNKDMAEKHLVESGYAEKILNREKGELGKIHTLAMNKIKKIALINALIKKWK